MYLKKTPDAKGRIRLSIVDSYYDKQKKCARQITVESIGFLEELEKTYSDPIAHFTDRTEQLKAEKKLRKAPINLEFFDSDKLEIDCDLRKNFGYALLSKIYHELGIHSFLDNRQRFSKEEYSANAIMKLLVFSRLLAPCSKLKTFNNRIKYFESANYSLDDVYRCLSLLNKHKDNLLIWLNNKVKEHYGRDSSLVYYDVTNFYFETDKTDDFKKKGVSKEHRPNPIVQLGLFMDNNNLPITYKLFSGNINDCLTFRPNLGEMKRHYGLGKVIVVADKGMTTGDNIWYTLSAKDGYVFSMSVRGADADFRKYIIDETDYTWQRQDYKSKSRRCVRDILVTVKVGDKTKKVKKQVNEKQVIFYSEKYAKRAKMERAAVILKAKQLIKNPGSFKRATSYGAAGYVKNIEFDKKTGEILENDKALVFDTEKLKSEEAMDGYYAIITSEMERSDSWIIEKYRGLWKIEESFRVTKTDIEARPIYVTKEEHIEAHFLTCFVSLLIGRILENKLDGKYCIGKILESLRKCECSYASQNFYLFDYCDEVLVDLGGIFGIDFTKRIRTLKEIKNILASTKKQK